jgi:hypothetical protein
LCVTEERKASQVTSIDDGTDDTVDTDGRIRRLDRQRGKIIIELNEVEND